MLNIVLHAPRIPQNTGQIARACLAMNCRLHLIRPLGFRLTGPEVKRSAVGYLDDVDLTVHASGEAFWQTVLFTFFYTDVVFRQQNLAETLQRQGGFVPGIRPGQRTEAYLNGIMHRITLNLATSTCVVMFEALRQIG